MYSEYTAFEQTLGDSGEQGRLACYCPWHRKELDVTERLNIQPLGTEPMILGGFGCERSKRQLQCFGMSVWEGGVDFNELAKL